MMDIGKVVKSASEFKCLIAFVVTLFAVIDRPALAEESTVEVAELNELEITKLDRSHWAYCPLQEVQPPKVADPDGWILNDIDRFILDRLRQNQLTPAPVASRVTLIRRVTFDLTGLPPSPDEVSRFLQDSAPDAWERLIDRLLASTAYGERWAQHWLDLARFAETDGFEHDLIRPNAWRYRDWVIDALNADMPYHEFVQRQIAGDLLFPDEPTAAIPTGFLLCGPDMPDINLQEERRHTVLNEMTSTTGAVFLGLQVGCAQCHNHMFDPIGQADFYRLRAFFESTEWNREWPLTAASPDAAGRMVREGKSQTARMMIRGDFRRPGPVVQPAVPRIAVPVSLDSRDLHGTSSTALDAPAVAPRVALARWLTQPDNPLSTRVMVNRLWQFHFGHGLVRTPNDFGNMGDTPSHSALLDWLAAELPRCGWSLKQMHRLMLTSATWRQTSTLDSAVLGTEAKDPEATQAARESWQQAQQVDPENRLLWRMNRMRLEGESIRDTMLFVAGKLNRQPAGPGVRPPLPPEIVSTLLKNQWKVTSDVDQHSRRSIYLFVRRNLRFPLFEAYDRPDTNASCPSRNRSTIAPQALVLLNSEISLQAAQDFAGRMYVAANDSTSDRIQLAFRWTIAREPTTDELAAAVQFLSLQAQRIESEQRELKTLALPSGFPLADDAATVFAAAAFTDFCLALFNLNEFVYLD